MQTLGKLTWVELKLFVREPVTLIFTLVLPLIFLFVMGEVFSKNPGSGTAFRGAAAIDYYLPAYIGVVMAATGIVALPLHIAGYREKGILKRLRASSLPVYQWMASQITVSLIITLVSLMILIMPAVWLYHAGAPTSPGLVIGSAILALLAFTFLGILLGSVIPTTRAAQGAGMPLFFLMFILSGSGPPKAVMSTGMQNVGQVFPLWHATSLAQDAWLGYGWNTTASLALAGYLVISIIISILVFKWE